MVLAAVAVFGCGEDASRPDARLVDPGGRSAPINGLELAPSSGAILLSTNHGPMRIARLVLTLALAIAVCPTAAMAHGGVSASGSTMRYYALDGGGISDASVYRNDDGLIEVSDPPVFGGISPGECIPYTEQRVACPPEGIRSVVISVGPEADKIESRIDLPTSLEGGPGDDVVLGGPGPDRIGGSGGRDTLVGGPADDRIVASGDRTVDTIDCGPGNDTAVADPDDVIVSEPECETVQRVLPSVAPPPGSLGPDVIPPAISRLRVRAGPLSARSRRRWARMSWRVSENGLATFRLVRCRAFGASPCVRRRSAIRPFQLIVSAGRGSELLPLPRKGRGLRAGRYVLRARAVDEAGNRSRLATTRFSIRR